MVTFLTLWWGVPVIWFLMDCAISRPAVRSNAKDSLDTMTVASYLSLDVQSDDEICRKPGYLGDMADSYVL